MRRFFIETFGCQMNVVDSEKAAALLERLGYEWTDDPEQAEVIVLNTCSVREKPEEKVYTRIRQLRRRRGDRVLIGVMGCVAQLYGRKLLERVPGVDFVVGTQALAELPQIIERLRARGEPAVVQTRTPNRAEFLEISPAERRQRHVAYVTIMEGCDKFCSFCIVPFTRGRERSRSPIRILTELRALAQAGYREVHLLGQNVNSYGLSERIEGDRPLAFSDLLRLVAEQSGLPRIKFTTSHPKDFTPEIVRAIEAYPNLCNWIHLPPQAGSDRILARMNRGYTRADYMRRVEWIRSAKREITLTGDIIVGFPGETERDFQETLRLIEEVEFDGLYLFKYSPRPGTPAARLPDQVPDEVKTERLMRLEERQREIQLRRLQRYVGRIVEVLVEGKSVKSEIHWAGHTTDNIVVNFEDSRENIEGALVKVEITRANPHSLFGRSLEVLR
ncbi:MAG: tRNA (N6-isopentenyl adenosine(37)-C2)-methylthiotransferase MiaB [Blastocatellia bacterium]|nr:tRNA (N6-isopentenyl adenosine(37)-C2)-methylthiotransferase MiaB [Blastocatellia bacterium]MCX7752535.1 tRNA (N6-isopentenyl adenosine(37)-C2)-methylthiotransferase MiaB [Blastocatellia bacterium]MDW8257325.1 tRNA (N6-isopentenyl adenosine(37)-C2)-methylthiotransferase MiaB [Acidobacteriota bacterium]